MGYGTPGRAVWRVDRRSLAAMEGRPEEDDIGRALALSLYRNGFQCFFKIVFVLYMHDPGT